MVFADHSPLGRGDHRGQQSVQRSGQYSGHAAVQHIHAAGMFLERCFIFILATPVTENPETNRRYREGFKKLIAVGGQHGWGEYRTAPCSSKA